MSQNISSFITGFAGGLRPNRFSITIGGVSVPFHIRAASMPAASTNSINIPYRGRVFKMPGWRSYATWNITVLDDNKIVIGGATPWTYFHNWANSIFNHATNIGAGGNFTVQMKPILVNQLDINGNVIRTLTLQNAWPSDVGEVRLSMDDNESYNTFNVAIEYSGYV